MGTLGRLNGSTAERMTIVVSGMVAGDPQQGGATWAVLQYVLGLRALGHDVALVEPVDELRPASVVYAHEAMAAAGFDQWSLLEKSSHHTAGLDYSTLRKLARDADILLNVSGMLTDEALLEPIPARVYLDLDPAFVQLWHAVEGIDMGFDGHTHFVTVGSRIGTPGCTIPTCGRDWISTVPPVVLSEWPVADAIVHDAFTTVGNWRGYGSITHEGTLYGQRVHSLRPLLKLPTRTDEQLLLAVAIHPDESADLEALDANGWELIDPRVVAGTPDAYRSFIQGSKAELGIAKSGYVVSQSGWFSDRSACYLASGRPVVAQDTGFGDRLPTGEGLLTYRDEDGALTAIDAIADGYERHRTAARQLAEAHLDARLVLGRLLDRLGSP
jgi:hypothetical protein